MVHIKVYLDHIQHLEIGTEESISFKECLPNLKQYTLYRTEIYIKDRWRYKVADLSPVYFYLTSKKIYFFQVRHSYVKKFKEMVLEGNHGTIKLFITTSDKVLVTMKINDWIIHKISDGELDLYDEVYKIVKKDFNVEKTFSRIISTSLVKLNLSIRIKKKRWFDFFFL
jgi:hypothetical protein